MFVSVKHHRTQVGVGVYVHVYSLKLSDYENFLGTIAVHVIYLEGTIAVHVIYLEAQNFSRDIDVL